MLWELGEVEELGAAMEGFDGVGAGEDKPVVTLTSGGAEVGEGCVEGGEGGGGDDFDGGDYDGGGSEGFELGGEVGGLVAGSGDEDAFVGQDFVRGWHPVGIVCLARGCFGVRNCNRA